MAVGARHGVSLRRSETAATANYTAIQLFQPCVIVAESTLTVLVVAADRLELFVRSRKRPKAESDNICSVQRQRQLPLARPGTFIRASCPKFSKSCSGAIARAAAEDQANPISAGAASSLEPGGRFR